MECRACSACKSRFARLLSKECDSRYRNDTEAENLVAQASPCRAGQATAPGGHGDASPTN
jgi:hypothetical protein